MLNELKTEEVITALYKGILGRDPDAEGLASAVAVLEQDRELLPELIRNLVSSPERTSLDEHQPQIFRALYHAALGREPDPVGLATYSGWMAVDVGKGMYRVADALQNSSEYQDRLLPFDRERVIVDHSPNKEFRTIVRYLGRASEAAPMVVEVGVQNPNRSLALDLAKYLGWEALLIEDAPTRETAIESRFAGTNFSLIQVSILEPDARQPNATKDLSQTQLRRMVDLALDDEESVQLSALSETLSARAIPPRFMLLAISAAPNAKAVVDQLIQFSDYRPELIVIAAAAGDSVTLQQAGFGEYVTREYSSIATTEASIVLSYRARD